MKRISTILILLGIIVIVVSMFSGGRRYDLLIVTEGNPEGFIFEANQDVYVNVTLDHSIGVFDMYLLHWQDANDTMAQNRSTDPISPIRGFENITSFNGILQVPFPGLFVLLFTTDSTDLLILALEISTEAMNTRAPLGGLVLAAVGAATLVCRRLYEHISQATHQERTA